MRKMRARPVPYALAVTRVAASITASQQTGARTPISERGFGALLGGIALAGLVIRVSYGLVTEGSSIPKDGLYYHYGAILLTEGEGFADPIVHLFTGDTLPAAIHPPAWTTVLAVPSIFGLESELEHQLFACLIGAVTIVLVGLCARRVAGPRAGLVGGAIAAVYPFLWIHERSLLSETLLFPLVAATILTSYHLLDRPGLLPAVLLGAGCGLLALTRTEQLLLLPVLVAPLVLTVPSVTLRTRALWLTAATGVAALIIAPWVVYNNTRFEETVLVSTNGGMTLSAANCRATYSGEMLGYRDYDCAHGRGDLSVAAVELADGDHSVLDSRLREKGTRYARAHLTRLPAVVLAREGRAFGVYRPFQQMHLDAWDTSVWNLRVGFLLYWLLVPVAVVGAVVLRRRRVALWPLLAFVVIVAAAVALAYGNTRYRAPTEVPLVVLGAVGVDAMLRRLQLRTAVHALRCS